MDTRIKSAMQTAVALALAAAGVIQLPPLDGRTNPPIRHEQRLEAHLNVPPQIETLLNRACKNCHSNETAWPWYSRLQPMGWLMVRDVSQGREAMNFSRWSSGPGRRPEVASAMLAAACANVQSGRMPLKPYQLLHPESRLSEAETRGFCEWTTQESRRLLASRKRLEASTALKFASPGRLLAP